MKNKIIVLLLAITGFAFNSCVQDDLYDGPAIIQKVTATPAAPSSIEPVKITAEVTDLRQVTEVTLKYKESTATTFTSVAMVLGTNNLYTGQIPPFVLTTKIQYYIEAKNINSFTTTYPDKAPDKLSTYTVGASSLVSLYINEVFSDGTKDATNPDWVEIYNASDVAVDLGGYGFYDDGIKNSGGTKPKRIIKPGTMVASKGYIVLNTEYTNGEVDFGLSTSGDAVYLDNPNGALVTSLDFLTINLAGKKSYGHKPNATGPLTIFDTPTKGASNN
ncbi:lamin tail domain-containing protein [Kaistella jeonii]|uniref:LTD domain-containing protein n=1 Tax=Kaistella jeonii TaxID=266749 RepID=A0A0C1FDF2_9FLAO|nr:lamin tail domain-containing protein [Kaistella jeonii]KIA89858.1 hypothetical protein OA86_04350 [Kaistella jeonii]SFB84782.1 Lamin Tail Domain [Kaistella jeonii]VEI96096.1 Uncharacterised protein [Kaistella jeonii]